MYAIRSYYAIANAAAMGGRAPRDVRDMQVAVSLIGLSRVREIVLAVALAEFSRESRITSYNVCYTKLLRWLGLLGLIWLEDEVSPVGSAEDCVVRLPSGPPHLGDLRCRDGRIEWLPVGGPVQTLQTDRTGDPTRVVHGAYA